MMIERLHPGQRMSEAVIHHDTVYLSGQVASDATADVAGQTRQVLAAIDGLLAQCGSNKTQIIQAQIFLSDINDFAAMNAVWDAWVVAGQTPARATTEARLASPEYRVEILVIAARP